MDIQDTPRSTRPFFTISELATYLDIGIKTIYRWREQSYGPPMCRLGPRKIIYFKDDVDRWMREQRKIIRFKPKVKARRRPNNRVPQTPAA